jgi:hypothetical protein
MTLSYSTAGYVDCHAQKRRKPPVSKEHKDNKDKTFEEQIGDMSPSPPFPPQLHDPPVVTISGWTVNINRSIFETALHGLSDGLKSLALIDPSVLKEIFTKR